MPSFSFGYTTAPIPPSEPHPEGRIVMRPWLAARVSTTGKASKRMQQGFGTGAYAHGGRTASVLRSSPSAHAAIASATPGSAPA